MIEINKNDNLYIVTRDNIQLCKVLKNVNNFKGKELINQSYLVVVNSETERIFHILISNIEDDYTTPIYNEENEVLYLSKSEKDAHIFLIQHNIQNLHDIKIKLNKSLKFLNSENECLNIKSFNNLIKSSINEDEKELISDGYHTFKDLYDYRKLYNALYFNELYKSNVCPVYKSKRHYDGNECFGGGWFIVVAITSFGQIDNHYELKDWNLFQIPEVEKSTYEFDGHTPQDCLVTMENLAINYKQNEY